MADEGSVSVILMSATFKGEIVTTFKHEADEALIAMSPNFFCVMIGKPKPGVPRIIGGLIMQSSLERESPAFQSAVEGLIARSPPLKKFASVGKRLFPAILHVTGTERLADDECERTLSVQFYNLSSKPGSA